MCGVLRARNDKSRSDSDSAVRMMVSKVLCIYDFVSDVWAVQANAHSDKKPLHILGYLGAALLTVSCMVNMIIVRRVTRVHREKLFKGISKMAPLQYYMSRIFACSNPEVMCSFLIMRADANRPRQLQEIQVAIRELKEYGLVSQTFEDIPQLLVQAYSALLCIYHGWKVPVPVLASLCMSLAMVLVKLLGNCFVPASVQANQYVIPTRETKPFKLQTPRWRPLVPPRAMRVCLSWQMTKIATSTYRMHSQPCVS